MLVSGDTGEHKIFSKFCTPFKLAVAGSMSAVAQLTNVQSTKSEAAVTVRKKSVSCFTPTCVNTLKTCIFFSF